MGYNRGHDGQVADRLRRVFQSLEKFFPIIGKSRNFFSNRWKILPFFPTIGKNVSNHWKKSFQSLENLRSA